MITLNGTLQDHGGGPIAGQAILIMPTPAVTIDTTGDVVHLGGTETTTDETGFFTADLAHAPGLTYTVRSTAGGRLRPVRFSCDDLTDGSTIDLSDVAPAPAPSPLASYVRGASAYEVAVDAGFVGTEADWLASLTNETTINYTGDVLDVAITEHPEHPGLYTIGA